MYSTANYMVQQPVMPAGAIAASLVVSLGIMVYMVFYWIAWGKMFRKAGQPWERLFVPFYGLYWMYKIARCQAFFWANIILIVLFVVGSAFAAGSAMFFGLLALLCMLPIIILQCVYSVRLAKSFGKGGGFGFGLIVLPAIFILILGFGKYRYQYGSND